MNCELREERLFCDLPPEALHSLDSIKFLNFYPKGAMLFVEGQSPRGVFVLCNGGVKLSSSSSEGKTLMRIAGPGEVIGLSSTILEKPYEATAETMGPCQVNFIRREDFMKFLHQYEAVSTRVVKHLSLDYQMVSEQARSIALSNSAEEKLVRILIGWCEKDGVSTDKGTRVKITLTHEEMGQMIGASRETVTRVLADLKAKGIIELKGSSLFVKDKGLLASIVAS